VSRLWDVYDISTTSSLCTVLSLLIIWSLLNLFVFVDYLNVNADWTIKAVGCEIAYR
jgi:hypothetical protein